MLLALGLFTAWNVLVPGVAAWENIVVAALGSLRLTGPVSAAFAAWVAMRRRRALPAERACPRPGSWRALRVPLAILLVAAGSFGATVLVLSARGMLAEQAGRLVPSGLAAGVGGLALYVALGWITGWTLPRAITPAVAGLGSYGLFGWLAGGTTWGERLAPATGQRFDLFAGLSAGAYADQALWLFGVSAALLFGWAAVVTRQAVPLAVALLAVLAAGAGVARMLSEPGMRTVAAPVAYACQEWPITVCVHPGMRAGLDDLTATFITLASRLAGTPAAFSRVEQRPRGDDERLPQGVVAVHLDDLRPGYAERAAADFVARLAPRCAGAARGYRDIVTAWLRGTTPPAGALPEQRRAAAWFSALTESQRRAWLRMFYGDFATCALTRHHFAGDAARPAALPGRHGHPVGPSPGW